MYVSGLDLAPALNFGEIHYFWMDNGFM